MNECLNYIYLWFRSFTTLIFTNFRFTDIDNSSIQISYGYVCLMVLAFGILVNSILNIPRAFQHVSLFNVEEQDDNGNWSKYKTHSISRKIYNKEYYKNKNKYSSNEMTVKGNDIEDLRRKMFS